ACTTHGGPATFPAAAMKIDAAQNAQMLQSLSQAAATLGAGKAAPQALQAHAMEEVAMVFSKNVERSSKALDKRQLDLTRVDLKTGRVEKLEKMLEWYSQLGHPGRVGLVELARQTATQLQRQPSLQ